MAYTKILVIKSRLDARVNYAINEEKTSGLDASMDYALNENKTIDKHILFESSVNCLKDTAHSSMLKIKKRYKKTSGIQGYHVIQSFMPKEVTPELAHKIGVEFTEKCFGSKYQAVIGTHLDKKHLHNHIVINSVSFIDGKKYGNTFKDYYGDIRGISDELCEKYGLSIIERKDDKESMSYIEWLARHNKRNSWQTIIRNDIDDCIKQAFDYGNFLVLMAHKGYEIKQGKYIAFRPYGKERFSRGYKLGDKYSRDDIQSRIKSKDLSTQLQELKIHMSKKQNNNLFPKGKITGIKALYVHYLYLMGLAKKNELPDKAAFVLKEDILKFERMTKTFKFLTDRNLDTIEQVQDYKSKCYETIDLLKADQLSRKKVSRKKKTLYEALTTLNTLKKPYELYLDGYTGMQKEYDEYQNANTVLKSAGYETTEQLKQLENEKSKLAEVIARNGGDIKHFRYEIRMCDKALESKKDIVEKLNKIEPQQKSNERKIEYDTTKR